MTAVEQFWKDVQDILPSSVDTETGIKLVRAYEQAKEMDKEQKIEFACAVYDKYNFGPQEISFREECEQFKSE